MPSIMFRVPTVEEQFERILALHWVGPCPPDEPGAPCINDWVYTVARASAKRPWGIRAAAMDRAIDLTRQAMTRAEKGDEVRRAFLKAYGQAYDPSHTATERVELEPFNPDLMRQEAAKVPIDITYDLLTQWSPRDVRLTSTQYLDSIFPTGFFVAVKNAENDRGIPYRVGDPESARKIEEHIKCNTDGAWYYTGPVSGKYRVIREEKPDGSVLYRMGACYGDDVTVCCAYALLESDHKGYEQEWLKIIVSQALPIVALYTSGNVSVHALVRVDAKSKEEFNRIADGLKRLVPLGACPGSLTATRATRLPGVVRGDNDREQRLLYLSPDADGSPILKQNNPGSLHG